ncbi:MAG: YggS family pyridoxal phosphate-dependent enzyme [Fimbriimonadales bacterium]|nr:YggS family pyridoxal phosphate-dependent enzyme [Fimbriimonadales bacterium]
MSIASNFRMLQERIEHACSVTGRDPGTVTLIAATKSVPPESIIEAAELGIKHFGENYLQEAVRKRPFCPAAATWHFIGRIQGNKARRIGEDFGWVHTVDSVDKAVKVGVGASKSGRSAEVLIEVNIAREPQKAGVLPEEVANLAELVYHLPGVRLRGLMTMGPANRNAEEVRPYFQAMRRLLEGLSIEGANCLSMGMSHDFDVAIQEGATHVRIGTALFGHREN